MVILQRIEATRNKVLYFLTFFLSSAILIEAFARYSEVSTVVQLGFLALGAAAVAAIVISLLQLYSLPRRSHALIIHRSDEEMILATNLVHEGFKLRYLRDALSENVYSFSDDDRSRLKSLELDGYHPALLIRNVRKVLLLRMCTMMFDDVFVVDRADRWEHHDSSNSSEPSFHKREMPPLRAWKGIGSVSA